MRILCALKWTFIVIIIRRQTCQLTSRRVSLLQFFISVTTVLELLEGAKLVKFIYSEKATKFCEIFPLLLTPVHTVKGKGKISQNFVAFEFSECMNFTIPQWFQLVLSTDYGHPVKA